MQRMSKPLRIYVSGPYSNKRKSTRTANVNRAVKVGLHLMKKGHLAHVPHAATGMWDGDLDYENYMELDLSLIVHWANALYYMGSSPGADRERACAIKKGIPIFENLNEVPNGHGR